MTNHDPLHVHVYGPPGVGKSTLAPAIYTELKIRGVRTELVMEVAKEYLWEDRLSPERQVLISSEQMHREERLRRHTDVIVTESPALLGVVYALPHQQKSLRECVLNVTQGWSKLSFLMERDLTHHYEQTGRQQSQAESAGKAIEIRQLLEFCRIPYELVSMPNDPKVVRHVAASISNEIEREFARMQRVRLGLPSAASHLSVPLHL